MKPGARFSLILWFVLAGSVPAYANDPPAPDGLLSLVMIFPVAIVGLRWAGAKLPQQARKWRVLKRIGLGLAFLMTLAGTGVALIPLLILLYYGVKQGAQVIRFGRGHQRFAIGGGVVLFTFFAVANYLVSLNYAIPPVVRRETTARFNTEFEIVTAEVSFQSAGTLDVNKNGIGEYGTLEQLHQAGLLDANFLSRIGGRGYRYVVVLSGDPARDEKQFLVYATPTNYGQEPWWQFVSLLKAMEAERPPYARRTFASDETGVIRARDLGGSRAVTREEAQNWETL